MCNSQGLKKAVKYLEKGVNNSPKNFGLVMALLKTYIALVSKDKSLKSKFTDVFKEQDARPLSNSSRIDLDVIAGTFYFVCGDNYTPGIGHWLHALELCPEMNIFQTVINYSLNMKPARQLY